MKKEKLLNIEAMRIFAILCTIMIHVTNVYFRAYKVIPHDYFFFSVLFNSVARICVPVFFMISGALLIPKEEDLVKYRKRIVKFVIVLAVWSVIYMLFNNSLNIKSIVASFFNAESSSRHLWYMYALLGLYLALPFIRRMCNNMTEKEENLFLILWCTLSGLQVLYMPLARAFVKGIDITYPAPIIEAAYYLGYFVCGHILYKRYKDYKATKKTNWYIVLAYVVSTLITALVTYFASIKVNRNYDIFFWYRSIFIIISSACVFLFFVVNKDKFKSEKIADFSKYTFGIYLIHGIFFGLIRDNYPYINCNSLYMTIPLVLLIYLISLVATIILKKIPYVKELL